MFRFLAWLVAIAGSCVAATAGAQSGPPPAILEGLVVDRTTRAPVSGARVTVEGSGTTADADSIGRFRLQVPGGTIRVRIESGIHQTLEASETVSPGARLEVRYALTPTTSNSYETVVTSAPAREEVSRQALRREEVTRTPGTMGDPFRVIEALPGVVPIFTGVPYYYVRGAPPADTGYFVDGIRIPALFHLALGPSVVHPALIDGVGFWSGGAPARFPGYVGGIVAATTGELPRDRPHLDLDLRFVDAGALVSVPFLDGHTRVSASGRYSYTAALLSALDERTFVDYWDYQLRVEQDLGTRGRATLFAFGSFDEIGTREEESPGAGLQRSTEFAQTFHRLDGRVDLRLDGGRRLQLAVGAGFEKTLLGDGALFAEERTIGPRVLFRTPLAADLTLDLGAEASYGRSSLELREGSEDDGGDGFDDLLPERDLWTASAWSELRVRLSPGTLLTAGARATGFRSGDIELGAIDPRLSLRQRLAPGLSLTGSIGTYHQPPAFVLPVPALSNLDFARGLQRSLQLSQGLDWQLGGSFSLEAQLFFHRYENLSDLSFDDDFDELDDEPFPRQEGHAYGVEVILRRKLADRLFGWIGYTLSRSERRFDAYRQPGACTADAPDVLVRGGLVPADVDRTHVLNAVASYELGRGFRIGARLHLRTGRPFTRSVCFTGARVLEGPRAGERLPPYFRLDLRIDKRWHYAGWDLELSLDVTNVTFSVDVLDMEQHLLGDGTYSEPAVPADSFRFFIPTLGLRAIF